MSLRTANQPTNQLNRRYVRFHVLKWRPITAIRSGDSGQRPSAADPNWTPLLATPFHPEYPSAHQCIVGSIVGTLYKVIDTLGRWGMWLASFVGWGLACGVRWGCLAGRWLGGDCCVLECNQPSTGHTQPNHTQPTLIMVASLKRPNLAQPAAYHTVCKFSYFSTHDWSNQLTNSHTLLI